MCHVVTLPNVGLLLAIHFLVYLAFNFFWAFPVHAATDLGWSPRGVGFFFSPHRRAGDRAGSPAPCGVAARGRPTLAGVGGIILAGSFLLFAARSGWVLTCGAAILALGNGLMWPSLLSLLSKSAGPSAQGAAEGIVGSIAAVAGIAGLVENTQAIEAVYVLPSRQGQGIGRALLRWLESSAKAAGIDKVWLLADGDVTRCRRRSDHVIVGRHSPTGFPATRAIARPAVRGDVDGQARYFHSNTAWFLESDGNQRRSVVPQASDSPKRRPKTFAVSLGL